MALVFLSGGGSVGHLAPGFAVRDALRALGHDAVFVTPGEERETGWFASDEPPRLRSPAPRMGKGLLGKLALAVRMPVAILKARRLLVTHRPVAVLGLGGWPCAPMAIAASMRGVPLHLFAADAVVGLVVRRLAGRATHVWLADARAKESLPSGVGATVVGPVVRSVVRAARRDPARFGLDAGKKTLLVVGGSLGAKGLNARASEGLLAAVARDPGLASRVQVIHSTGTPEDAEAAKALYTRAGVAHDVRPFIAEIGAALKTADLVLCRGGAGTVAEVAALGRPAVFVPYPHHADRQQFKNVEPLVARGQAVVVEEASLTPEVFAREVLGRLEDERALAAMAQAADASPGGESPSDPATTIARALVRSNEGAAPPP